MRPVVRNYLTLCLISVAAILMLALAGCNVEEPISGPPAVTVVSPADGAILPGHDVTISTKVANIHLVDKEGQANAEGEGFLHLILDVDPAASALPSPIPAGGLLVDVASSSYTFKNLPSATYIVTVQLDSNDRTPISTVAPATFKVHSGYSEITAEELKVLIDKKDPDLIIIDITHGYAKGHIPTAVNYPLGEDLAKVAPTLDKTRKYVCYCHNDGVTREGAAQLSNAGFPNVYALRGSMNAWVNAGYKLDTVPAS
jgi:rhodanese-related sulfurtransferase